MGDSPPIGPQRASGLQRRWESLPQKGIRAECKSPSWVNIADRKSSGAGADAEHPRSGYSPSRQTKALHALTLMKGIVFTEFLEMVEEFHGDELADRIIDASDLESGGSYTSVGTYDADELVTLVLKLSEETGTQVPELLKTFGEHLFGRFVEMFPRFFDDVKDAMQFIMSVEDHIHLEVRKLYPDAELPRFEYEETGPGTIQMIYRSPRRFDDFAEGLIQGCLKHFGHGVIEGREVLKDGTRFLIAA